MKLRWLLLTLILLFGNSSFAQEGTEKYPFNFEALKDLSKYTLRNDTLIPVSRSRKFQYINSITKKIISLASFEEAYPVIGKYALVKKSTKYGIIDKNMKVIVPFTYTNTDDILVGRHTVPADAPPYSRRPFSFYKGMFIDVVDALIEPVGPQIYFHNEKGKYYYELNQHYENGKYARSAAIYDTFYVFSPNFALAKHLGKIGMLNEHGETVIPFVYDDISCYNQFDPMAYLFALKKDGRWHYFAGKKELFQNEIKPTMTRLSLFMFETNRLFNYFTKQGTVALPRNYKWIDDSGNMAIDAKGRVVLFNNKKEEFIYYAP